jgi:hypothetical protein
MTTICWDGKYLASDSHATSVITNEINEAIKIHCPKFVYIGEDKILAVAFAGRIAAMRKFAELLTSANAKVQLQDIMDLCGVIRSGEKFSAIILTEGDDYILEYRHHRVKGFSATFSRMVVTKIKNKLPMVIGSGTRTLGKYSGLGLTAPAMVLVAIGLDGFSTGGTVSYLTKDDLDYKNRSHLTEEEYAKVEKLLRTLLVGTKPHKQEPRLIIEPVYEERLIDIVEEAGKFFERMQEATKPTVLKTIISWGNFNLGEQIDGNAELAKWLSASPVLVKRISEGQLYGEWISPGSQSLIEIEEGKRSKYNNDETTAGIYFLDPDKICLRVVEFSWVVTQQPDVQVLNIIAHLTPYGPHADKLTELTVAKCRMRAFPRVERNQELTYVTVDLIC